MVFSEVLVHDTDYHVATMQSVWDWYAGIGEAVSPGSPVRIEMT